MPVGCARKKVTCYIGQTHPGLEVHARSGQIQLIKFVYMLWVNWLAYALYFFIIL